jgi:hypothetical protein
VKPPAFASQAEADEWMERAGKFDEAMHGARQVWLAEDDTVIGYNTTSVPGGGFYSFRYRPGPGGLPEEMLFVKHHARRKAAKQRALLLYRKYAPKWAATHTDADFS